MANDNLAKQLSCSWGDSSPGGPDPASEQVFLQMAAQGQSFFNASGDSDAFTDGIPFPAESPNITQVGGTTLTTSGPGGNYVSETVWNWGIQPKGYYVGSSGGVSSNYTIPVWQQDISMVTNQGSTSLRNVPDVALTADNVYVIASNGVAKTVGGTSCAAPLWAALTALINQEGAANGLSPVGFLNPTFYALCKGTDYDSCFHDITTGNNTNLWSANTFFAVAGYDLCTGWGTPKGANLINALAGVVYVDHAYAGPAPSDGSLAAPFRTVTEGYQVAHFGNIICVFGGNYPETLVMDKRLYLRGTNGLVTIGSP
jgi:subtilase family serine protease